MERKATPIHCRDVAIYLGTHLDHFFRSTASGRVQKHLDSCPNCDAYLDSLKKVIQLYRQYPCPDLGPRLRERLRSVLELLEKEERNT